MWPTNYWNPNFFAPNYFPRNGLSPFVPSGHGGRGYGGKERYAVHIMFEIMRQMSLEQRLQEGQKEAYVFAGHVRRKRLEMQEQEARSRQKRKTAAMALILAEA